MEKNNKIKTSLTDQSNSYEFDEKEQIILYRSINELLQNVIKHSKAKEVNVSFKQFTNDYIITISDNGIGFDLEAMRGKAISQKKFGLFSLMERIRFIGGEVIINSVPNKGTKAVINLPIKK
jgi:signal transduction histidine kinase